MEGKRIVLAGEVDDQLLGYEGRAEIDRLADNKILEMAPIGGDGVHGG
jgi:hypothetical protein